jgi:hypothetical protein
MTANYKDLLTNWDVKEEQNRADFLEILADMYNVTDGLYTGLWEAFKQEAAVCVRDIILSEGVQLKSADVGELE